MRTQGSLEFPLGDLPERKGLKEGGWFLLVVLLEAEQTQRAFLLLGYSCLVSE